MKLYNTVLIILLLASVTACKKQHTEPQRPDNGSVILHSVVESFNNQTSTYLCHYNTNNQLQDYVKQDGSEKYSYTYDNNRIKTATYTYDGKTYYLELNYAPTGEVSSGIYKVTSASGEPTILTLTCTSNGDQTLLKTYQDIFTLTVKTET